MTGYRVWSTGDTVSAADFTSYISTQSWLIFADASARTSAVSSPVDGMVSMLTTDNVVSIYTGSAWVDVLDVDTLTVSSGNYTVTGTMTFGADGSGVDTTWHSATAGDGMVWSAASESLTITGTNAQNALVVADGDVSITDNLTVSGSTFTYLNVITDSTTTRTPALTDAGAYILTTHGTGITVTLPQNSAVAFPVGTVIYFERNGAGTLTFAAGTGATVTSKDSTLTCGDRYTTVAAIKIGTDAWSLIGNIG